MWQKIKFFFLRRMSDEKLRMWCVEQTTLTCKGSYSPAPSDIAYNAEQLFNYIRLGVPYTPAWS